MTRDDLSIIPLRSAVFCVSCEALSNATGAWCPVCCSPSLVNLGSILNRAPVAQVPDVIEMEFANA
jgi:hypothetical protein